ncbi:MAG: FecR domain-containing protein [Alphaproteobacteria bacterium]
MKAFLVTTVLAGAALLWSVDEAQAQARAPIKAGIAAAVRGKVERVAAAIGPSIVAPMAGSAIGITVASGDVIYLGDRISTGPNAGLQIMLVDETVFTIGPNAAMAVDEFTFDPATNNGKLTARIMQGAFRFVSGRIAKHDPKDMTVNLPQGSIGVRGTAVQGVVEGERATVMLLGPGLSNNAGERPGRIVVSGAAASGGEVLITRPGFATTLSTTMPPSEPVRLETQQAARISNSLTQSHSAAADGASGGTNSATPSPAQQSPSAPGTNVVRQSGQGAAGALGPLGGTAQAALLAQNSSQSTVKAAQDSAVSIGEQSTWEQVRTIHSGTATFNFGTVNLVPTAGTGSGSYTLTVTMDFGARTASAAYSGNYTVGALTGTINAGNNPVKNYAQDSGLAQSTDGNGHTLPGGATMKDFFKLKNDVTSRTIAKTLENRIEISDSTSTNVIATQGGKAVASR